MPSIKGEAADHFRNELKLSRKIHDFKLMVNKILENCPRDKKKVKYNILNRLDEFEYSIQILNSASYYGFRSLIIETLPKSRAKLDIIDMDIYDLKTEYNIVTDKQFKKTLDNYADIRNLFEAWTKYLLERLKKG